MSSDRRKPKQSQRSQAGSSTAASPRSDRAEAARTLGRILGGGDPDALLAEHSPQVRQTCLGSLRRLPSLRAHLAGFMKKPLRPADRDVECLLIVGAYQLTEMDQPDHAVVNDCVNAAGHLNKPWAKGLINAVLRRCAGTDLKPDERSFDHSQWLFKAIRRDYPERWREIVDANNQQAPMWLRINTRRTTVDDYAAQLAAADIAAEPGSFAETVGLSVPRRVSELPGFHDGLVSVQDHSAQAVARAIFDFCLEQRGKAPDTLLDACAAPGGKAFHLAELFGTDTSISAVEVDTDRLVHMAGEASRLGHDSVALIEADATALPDPAERFDLILCDAPCSGTGTLRRHPDIKVRRRRADVDRVRELQLALLHSLWQHLDAGATLAYCTCSILSDENDAVLSQFLAALRPSDDGADDTANLPIFEARIERQALPWGHATEHGWQTLPGERGGDGFYLAFVTKVPTVGTAQA